MAFPGTERVAYERERVFPLAGLERGQAERYYRVMELQKELAYAGSEAARRYLNGEAHSAAAERWLTPYALMEPAQARQRIRFLDTYRSYVINYNLGGGSGAGVRRAVRCKAGSHCHPERRPNFFHSTLRSAARPAGTGIAR